MLAQQPLIHVLAKQAHAGKGHSHHSQGGSLEGGSFRVGDQRGDHGADHHRGAEQSGVERHTNQDADHDDRHRGVQEKGIGKRVVDMHAEIIAGQCDGESQGQRGRVKPLSPLECAGENNAAAGQHQGE